MMNKWQNLPKSSQLDFLATSADCDLNQKLRVSGLVNMLLQTSWKHVEELDFGMRFMHTQKLSWVLSRMLLKYYSAPKWGEQVTVETWPSGLDRLLYLRDFRVRNSNNEVIAEAVSEWLLIDFKTKRPRILPVDEDFFAHMALHERSIDTRVPVLKSLEQYSESSVFNAVYSEIDLNKHFTAVGYIRKMFDTLDFDLLSHNQCSEIVLNYIREIQPGEKVTINKHPDNDNDPFDFEFLSDEGNVLFRGRISF